MRLSCGKFVDTIEAYDLDVALLQERLRKTYQEYREKRSQAVGKDEVTRMPIALQPLQRLRLTAREHEVLELTVRGLSNREIGAKLKISARTVELHCAKVMKKAWAHNLAGLMRAVIGPR